MSEKRILVVDDDVVFATGLIDSLKRLGYTVVGHVMTGADAIRTAKEKETDLVLMDIELKGPMNGVEAAEQLRAVKEIPVLYLTVHADPEIFERAKITEPFGYLIKPSSERELYSAIETALYKADAEKRLRETRTRLELALKGGALGLWDWNLETGEVFANIRASEMLGYPDEELRLDFDTWKEFIHPQDGPMVSDMLNQHLTGRTDFFEAEYRIHSKLGEWRWILARARVFEYGPDAKPSRMVGTFLDITAQKELELELRKARGELEIRVEERTAQLRESEERLRAIFDTARDCIFIKDLSLRYTFVNPSLLGLLELPESGIVGRTDEELFGKEAGMYLKTVESRVLGGATVEQEHTRPIKGGLMTFLDTRSPLRNSAGEVVGVCGISRNITERRQTQLSPLPSDPEYLSAAMLSTLETARLAAATESIILLTGESGAGKDFLARYIHDHSNRAAGPFYTINCAAVPSELAESELFGHEPGAFTGATRHKRGLLELAEGGTLLLNEIGELSLMLQAKLLAFLDTKEFNRVGGEKTVAVNARLIAATNRDLTRAVDDGRFREDLFYRLNVFSLAIPPLRERLEDIPSLVRQIGSQLADEMQLHEPPMIDQEGMERLCRYQWPGNIRELRNVLERTLILSQGGPLTLDHIALEESEPTVGAAVPDLAPGRSLDDFLADTERSLIHEALMRAKGNKKKAASILGISRFALARRVKKLGLDEQ